jgi:hypothetical protein
MRPPIGSRELSGEMSWGKTVIAMHVVPKQSNRQAVLRLIASSCRSSVEREKSLAAAAYGHGHGDGFCFAFAAERHGFADFRGVRRVVRRLCEGFWPAFPVGV